jgi:hypothetical protein
VETLASLESFVRSAETGSFSATAQRLALRPAAVSRNVALLERNLGVRLFQASLFLSEIGGNLDALRAVDDLGQTRHISDAKVRLGSSISLSNAR